MVVLPSKAYREYEKDAERSILASDWDRKTINTPVTVRVTYYMDTQRIVDLCNLLEATCDVLTHYGVLFDDNSRIIVSHDGSRVSYDKRCPRAEIVIEDYQQT